ncbi:MAG: primosomal protein N' [Acidobacteriota bacterium]
MFARVALPFALPEALSYLVPEDLVPLALPGVRVRVPLRGAPKIGLIVEVTDDPGCALDRILAIDEVLDPEPLVPVHVMEMIRFTADYYAARVGMVVRAAVPAQLLRLPTPLVETGARARELLDAVEGPERVLLERVVEAGRITLTRLLQEGWSRHDLRQRLDALVARYGVRVVERRPGRFAGGSVNAVVLADLPAGERDRRVGAAPAQGRVIRWLEAVGRPVLEAELLTACACTAGVIAGLARKGVVRRFPQARRSAPRRWELQAPPPPATLTDHQERAVAEVTGAIGGGAFRPFLLLGVTGSGKTEVYLQLAAAARGGGLQTVVLVPEIGLTPALAGQLSARFGDRVAVLHSSMGEGDRFAAWERARRGDVDVVAGPRSALWAPLPRPGLLVIDEEQDGSYKQDEEPRYHARDLGLVLGQRLGIPVVLCSATPSLEALALAEQGRLRVLELPERVSGGSLPQVEIVDLRSEEPEPGEHGQRFFSRRLRELVTEALSRDEQAIVLVNRRGWAPVLLCRECGHQAACGDCSIPLTVHRRKGALLCHYCGFRSEIPASCPRCGGEVLDHIGAGTEKIAARLRELYPAARVAILDRDTARSPAELVATLERFAARETQILVGTQMVSKGHHFPGVTLTAVINADNLLGFPDFRGAERTFHLLTQVAGRAGRGERPGTVVVQTYHPDHHAVRAALFHDVRGFAEEEMRYRRAFRYPPASRLALVRFEGESESATHRAAHGAGQSLEPPPTGVRVLGPTAAPLARLRGRWRVQILLLAPTRPMLREALERIAALDVPSGVRRVIDVDPQSTV